MNRIPERTLLLLLCCTGFLVLGNCSGDRTPHDSRDTPPTLSFWIWNRDIPLSPAEIESLSKHSVSRLYWQVGELSAKNGSLVTRSRFTPPSSVGTIPVIPVIRLDSGIGSPKAISGKALADWARSAGITTAVQFDYDCPTRLLPEYARLLNDFRAAFGPVELSITALGDWCHADDWNQVEPSIDAAFPMLYDIYPEKPNTESLQPRAIAQSEELSQLIAAWDRRVSIPWEVGLPNFRRLTVFRENQSMGHIRSWSAEDLLLNPDLAFSRQSGPGVFLYQVERPTRVGRFQLRPSDVLCLRECDRDELRQALTDVRQSSARGVTWFQLDRVGLASGGWSASDVARSFAGTPELHIEINAKNQLVLSNRGTGDWAPPWHRRPSVSIRWNGPSLREFVPSLPCAPTFRNNDREAPPFSATSFGITVTGLRAGEERNHGLLLFRGPQKSLTLEYRIDDSGWKPLSSTP